MYYNWIIKKTEIQFLCYSFSNQAKTKQERMYFHIASITQDMRYRLTLISYAEKYFYKQNLSQPSQTKKFAVDMIYGIVASESYMLTDISDQLYKIVRKTNTVKRLSNYLSS